MPFLKKIKTEVGLLGIWELSDTPEELEKKISFNSTECYEYAKIRLAKRKKEYLSARLLLKELLGYKPEIRYQETGKPVLNNSSLRVSISHSAQLVTIILSEKKIGIDVENTKRNIDRVAKRFLHKDEYSHISTLMNSQEARILYWSAKEAIFKCSDNQGSEFSEHIYIHPFELKSEGSFSGILNNSTHYKLWYFFYENNVIVYCVEENN